MGKAFDPRQVEYAYVYDTTILPNLVVAEVPAVMEGEVEVTPAVPAHFKSRITITYELKTADKQLLKMVPVEHWVEHDTKRTTLGIKQLFADNFKTFVTADKLELSGYQEA